MESQEQYNTLECVSNNTDGDLISTAKLTGVKFSDILGQAGVKPEATYVVFKATDGYSVGIPMAKAMDPGTILAYQINGGPLLAEHGFPARMIVPGYYGMMNCKWVTSIELVAETYQGYWQVRGWINEAQYETGSFIVTPGSAQVADRFGIAQALDRPTGDDPHRRSGLRGGQGNREGRGEHGRGQHLDTGERPGPALWLHVGALDGGLEPACHGQLLHRGPVH